MHDAQTPLAPAARVDRQTRTRRAHGPTASVPQFLAALNRDVARRHQCIAGAVLRVSHPFHGTFDGRVLGYDRIPGILRPLKLEFQNKHGDKVIDRFTLDEFKEWEVLA